MKPWEKLSKWRDDGTLRRIQDASDARTPVKIKRSSGAMQDAILASTCGFGGLMCVVAFADDLDAVEFTVDVGGDRVIPSDGTKVKQVDTEDLIKWNPSLGVDAGPA